MIVLENKDIFHAPLAGSTVIILYLFREVSGGILCLVSQLEDYAVVQQHWQL